MMSENRKRNTSTARRLFLGALATLPALASGTLRAATYAASPLGTHGESKETIKALVFDMQGTSLDFFGPMMQAVTELGMGDAHSPQWQSLPFDWNAAVRDVMIEIVAGRRPWIQASKIVAEVLDPLLARRGSEGQLSAEQRAGLLASWGKMAPWPDVIQGLASLRNRFVLATLSQAPMAGLVSIVKRTGMPFDAVLSAELAHTFKPDRRVYQLAVDYLGFPPDQIMMVAAHKWDLQGAKSLGLRTAYVPRPHEFGPLTKVDMNPEPYIDIMAHSFTDLAAQLNTAY